MARSIRKIVVACDSFKGSLGADDVIKAITEGLQSADPGIGVIGVPLADGGEGTLSIITRVLGARIRSCEASDPLLRRIVAEYAVAEIEGQQTAIIELASVAGLTLLVADERNLASTTTRGLGEMILDAWEHGCRSFIVGIGGSATNDGGMGMLKALGVRFVDCDGRELPDCGASLESLASIDLSPARKDILSAPFTIICDVTNPLYGPDGAAFVYAPQKGADREMVESLDRGLRRYAAVVETATGRRVADLPGAGAAGGVGAAFAAFFNARIERGIDAILRINGFDRLIADADMIITGEGRSDSQTLCGKAPLGVLQHARRVGKTIKRDIPVVILSGSVDNPQQFLQAGFADVRQATPSDMPLEAALDRKTAYENLRRAAKGLFDGNFGCAE